MSGPGRVLAFALALVAVFSGAAAVGYAVGPLERGGVDENEHATGGSETREGGPPAASGLAADITGTAPLAFLIRAPSGEVVRHFDLQHARRMHLIVVRNDLSSFRHVHPKLEGASWVSSIRLPAGAYTAYADFVSEGRRAVVSAPVVVDGGWRRKPLPARSSSARAGAYTVELDLADPREEDPTTLSFRVLRGEEGVGVDRYLGARGHLVVLRADDLAYLHTHAEEDSLDFETTFPSPGSYRAFLQFAVDGTVHTAAFTVEVPE